MRPGLGRRTRSRAAGPDVARGHQRHTINAPHRLISSVPSARNAGPAPGSYYLGATAPRWTCTWQRISQAVAPGAHAVVLLDQAGWHTSPKLTVPANISLLPLPPKSPELNPTENVWQYLRDNWLSNHCIRKPIATSSITAATPGTNSSISLGPSCPSGSGTGQWVLITEGWYYTKT